jgi:AraC-like DNA-binding protein
LQSIVKVLWVEYADYPAGWGLKEHDHEYYHLFYFLTGKSVFSINKKEYHALKDACFIVPPKALHALQKVSGETLTAFEIKFTVSDIHFLEHLDLSRMAFTGNEFVKTLITYIVDNGRSRVPYTMHCVNNYLGTLLIYLSGGKSKKEQKKDIVSLFTDTEGFSKTTVSIIIYIERNYMNKISLSSIAAYVKRNKNYICSLFKKETGITIADYINYVRIIEAARHFSYSDIDISNVCARVGFINVSHFTRTFKNFMGMSPRVYRRMFPLNMNGNLGKEGKSLSALESQIVTIGRKIGVLDNLI